MATSQSGACEFDRLFNKSVPNILEKVFFSLDLDSFTACREVCKTWKELFSTARFCKKAKEMELEMKKLLVAAGEGNTEEVKRLLMRGVHPNGDDVTTPLCVGAGMATKLW